MSCSSWENTSLDPWTAATLVWWCSWAAKSCIDATRRGTSSYSACVEISVPGWLACALNFTIPLQPLQKVYVKLKGKASRSFRGHTLHHLLQKAKHPNMNQLVSSSGRVLCNELRASTSATELCAVSEYHSSHKCFISLLVFVKWLDTVARSHIEKPLKEGLYNLQKTTLRFIT